MIHYFEEKAQQVDVGAMKSFGIEIHSRYSKAWELAEMLNFTTELASENLHRYVQSVFYDSKANICFMEFNSNLEQGSDEAEAIKKCVKKTLIQFQFFDVIGHGEHLQAMLEE